MKKNNASLSTWKTNSDTYQTLGEFIIESTNPNSSLSTYFKELKIHASQPEHDRIRLGLQEALNIINTN